MNRHIISKIILFFGLMLSLQLQAQEHLNRNMLMLSNINTDNGLSSARVYSIVEAEDGAMWISTKRGVDRYNGQVVRNYRLATDQKYSDASGRNIKLAKYKQQIYAYDNKGKLYIYNKVEDAFLLKWNFVSILGGAMVVNDIAFDHQGNCWVAMDRGVYLLYPNGKGKYIVRDKYANHISMIGSNVLIGSTDGAYLYSLKSQALRGILFNVSVMSSYHDVQSNQVWIGSFHKGVVVFDDRNWKVVPMAALDAIPRIPVRSILSYDPQNVLLGVDGAGVYAYDKQTKQLRLLLNTDGRPGNVLQGNGVYSLCRDRFGNLWVGSYSGGVDFAVPMEHTLEFVRHEYLNNQSLINNSVNDICQDSEGRLWYATDKGVSVFDGRTLQWRHGLYNKVALTLCQTRDGRMLVGTYGDGAYQMNADGSASQVYSTANGKLKTDYVYSIFSDSEEELWIGCLDGDMAHITSSGINYLPINEIQCVEETPDAKSIAVGTSHGCYLVDKHTLRVGRFFYPTEFADNDCNYFVNALAFQNGFAWIATDGGGIYRYDMKKHQVKQITTEDALPSNTIYTLQKDNSGRLWLSSDKGLAFIQHDKVVNLNFFKGLECEYKRMAVARTKDGSMIFGSSNGAVILASKFAKGLNYSAPLHITGMTIEGIDASKRWNQKMYDMLNEGAVSLSHDENTLVVSFESINYQYQHDIKYQYFLEGYDRQWSKPSSSEQARFANLAPGNYTLHVKAIGRSNGRVLGESSIKIHIAQPWWNSFLAWIVYLCILAAIAYFGWDYYKERLQRKYYDEKINFFVNTAHNIRTPLSLVLAPLSDLEKDDTLGEKSRRFLDMAMCNGEKLLRMITELLDFQKLEQAKAELHLQSISLPVYLRQQLGKFETLATEKNIKLGVKQGQEISIATDLSIMDLIFENLLSNAIKYTNDGGEVSVSVESSAADKQVTIKVADTGIGIPKTEAHRIFQSFFRASNAVQSQEMGSGLGLMLTRQLVQKLGGKLSFDSEEGKGTTFMVVLPIAETEKQPSAVAASSVAASVSSPTPTGVSVSEEISVNSASSVDKETTSEESSSAEQRDTLLFVDDNEDFRQYIRMAFSDKYHVVDVESGDAALKYLEENGECDIVVSDVMMPGMQGDELCRRIKENKETSWLPVILLTAKAGRDFMIEGLGLGADDYIAKPFDSAILASKIDSMLKNRRRLSQYYMERSLSLVRETYSSAEHTDFTEKTSTAIASSNEAYTHFESSVDKNISEERSDEPVLNPQDQAFVEKATRLVLDNLSDTDFNIDRLCREMAMSRTLFYGKLKNLTGQGPQDFMRIIRLEQAAQYLKQGESVLDVSVKAGFVNVKYFSTVFKKHFGVSPSKYE